MSTGKIRLFCIAPSPNNSSPATMRLEVDGTNIPISDGCGGVQQFANLLVQVPALDGEISGAQCSGGPAPSGTDNCILFLESPVDFPPMEKGRVSIGAVTLQIAHNGAYGIRTDSMMAADLDWRGGQIVLNEAAANQIGLLVQPRSALQVDTHGPVMTQSRIVFPSIVGIRGIGQQCAVLSHGLAPIGANEFEFMEPNACDYGIVVPGSGHGFLGNMVTVLGAHGQKYGCVDIGHGTALVGGGNIIKAVVGPEPVTGTGFDYWGHDDILDLQVIPGDTGNGLRGITLENGSHNLQCRIGQNVAVNPIVSGAGNGHPNPNIINGVVFQN